MAFNQCGNHLLRRDFLKATAALTAAGLAAPGKSLAQPDAIADFRPCIDVSSLFVTAVSDAPLQRAPVRLSRSDPLSAVDIALIEQNPDVAAWLSDSEIVADPQRMPMGTRAAGLVGGTPPARIALQAKWLTDKLKVYFYGTPASFVNRILDIANEWSKYANIDFTSTARRIDADIRVGFQPTGHWSLVGNENATSSFQSMNLQISEVPKPGEYNYGVVLHEFGHALGLIHEHITPAASMFFNEPSVIDYYRQMYGWSDATTKLNILARYDNTQLLRGRQFDTRSIMVFYYPPELTKDGLGAPVNTELSATDKYFIANLYPGRVDPRTFRGAASLLKESIRLEATALPVGTRILGAVTPSQPVVSYSLRIPVGGTYTLRVDDYSPLSLSLSTYSGKEVDMEATRRIGSAYRRTTLQLEPGSYFLEVRHQVEQASATYGVCLLQGVR